MENYKEISILQILKESLTDLKNKEIIIVTMTCVLLGTAMSKLYDPFNTFTVKKLIFYVFGQFVLLIGEMILIRIVDKKYKKEEVNIKNIIKELMPRGLSALALYLIMNILILLGILAVIIPGVLFSIYAAFYLQVFILENNGIRASIENSMKFSQGFRGYIFNLYIITITIGVINDEALLRLLKHLFNLPISSGVNIIIASVIDSFTIIVITSLYLKIKKIKTIE